MSRAKLFGNEGYGGGYYLASFSSMEAIDRMIQTSMETYQEIMDIGRSIERANDACYAIEKIHDRLIQAQSDRQLSDKTLEMSRLAVEGVAKSIGVRKMPYVSLESYYNQESSQSGFFGFIRRILKAIANAFSVLWDKVASFLGLSGGGGGGGGGYLADVKTKADTAVSNIKEEEKATTKATPQTVIAEMAKPANEQSVVTKTIAKEIKKNTEPGETLTEAETKEIVEHVVKEIKVAKPPSAQDLANQPDVYEKLFNPVKSKLAAVLAMLEANDATSVKDLLTKLNTRYGIAHNVAHQVMTAIPQLNEKLKELGLDKDSKSFEGGLSIQCDVYMKLIEASVDKNASLAEKQAAMLKETKAILDRAVPYKTPEKTGDDEDVKSLLEKLFKTDIPHSGMEVLAIIGKDLTTSAKITKALKRDMKIAEDNNKDWQGLIEQALVVLEKNAESEKSDDLKKVISLKTGHARLASQLFNLVTMEVARATKDLGAFCDALIPLLKISGGSLESKATVALHNMPDSAAKKKLTTKS